MCRVLDPWQAEEQALLVLLSGEGEIWYKDLVPFCRHREERKIKPCSAVWDLNKQPWALQRVWLCLL